MEIETIQVTEKFFQDGEKLFVKETCNIDIIADDGSIVGKFLMVRPDNEKSFSPQNYDYQAIYCEHLKDKELIPHKLQIVINRLEFPYGMDPGNRWRYTNYLKKCLPELIENHNGDPIIKYAEDLITKKNVDELIEKASNTKLVELETFLRDYKQNKFETPPMDPNSFNELLKEWMVGMTITSEIIIMGYLGKSIDTLTFPSVVGEKSISIIGSHFKNINETSPDQMIIPEGYIHISYEAFIDQTVAKRITLPNSLQHIGERAFLRSKGLEEINLVPGLVTIKPETFAYCESLKEIKIPGNITIIQDKAFLGCKDLAIVELENGLKSIEEQAFAHCVNLKKIKLPASLSNISPDAFDHSGITSIELDKDNTFFKVVDGSLITSDLKNLEIKDKFTIDSYSYKRINKEWSFYGSTLYGYRGPTKSVLTLPATDGKDQITTINNEAFINNLSLREINIQNNIETIGNKAFFGCKNIRDVKLGNSLKNIGEKAFAHCYSLKMIRLPASLSNISPNAFDNSGITLIELDKDNKYFSIENGALYSVDSKKTILSPPTRRSRYYSKNPDKNDSTSAKGRPDDIIRSDIQDCQWSGNLLLSADGHELISFRDSRQENHNSYLDCKIPEGVIKIEDHAFRDLYTYKSTFFHQKPNRFDLKKLVIPSHVKEISKLAFSGLGSETVQVPTKFYRNGLKLYLGKMRCLEVVDEDGHIIGKFSAFSYFSENNYIYKNNPSFQDYDNFPAPLEYDTIINGIPTRSQNVKLKIQNALDRLNFPYELSEEAAIKYGRFLKQWWLPGLINNNGIIKDKHIGVIIKLARHMITRKNVDAILEKASSAGITELVAFLLNYKQKNLKRKSTKLPLLTLEVTRPRKPRNPNSVREIEKNWKIINNNAPELTLAGYQGEKVDVLIFPNHKGKKPITHVGSSFDLSYPVTEIIISEGYKSLGKYAFYRGGPKNIKLPDSLLDIGEYAFEKNWNLEEIKLSSKLTIIRTETFCLCRSLRQIEILENVKEIGKRAFFGCRNLEEVKLGISLETIGEEAFADCSKLKSIKLPSNLKHIAPDAFVNSGIINFEIDMDNKFLSIQDGVLYCGETKIIESSHKVERYSWEI